MFVGGQHAHASLALLHYSSATIRRDAPTQLTDIASQFSQLCKSLIQSRRAEALALSQRLAEAERLKAIADNALEAKDKVLTEKDRALVEKDQALEERDQLIAYYEAVLGTTSKAPA